MRLATWNLGGNGGHDQAGAHDRLRRAGVEIALVQEATIDHLPAATNPFRRTSGRGVWGAAIATRLPIRPVDLGVHESIDGWLRIAAGSVKTDRGEVLVASVHPHFDAVDPEPASIYERFRIPNAKHLWHCDVAWGVLNEHAHDYEGFIIGGDWNTARGFIESSVVDAQFSEEFFVRAEAHGWHEVIFETHRREVPTYYKGVRAYQLDHLFISASLLDTLVEASIDEIATESDHLPVVAELTIIAATR